MPVVRRTGGLADTVFDVDDDGERAADAGHIPNGFSFDGTDSNALDYALNRRAFRAYRRRPTLGRCPHPPSHQLSCFSLADNRSLAKGQHHTTVFGSGCTAVRNTSALLAGRLKH